MKFIKAVLATILLLSKETESFAPGFSANKRECNSCAKTTVYSSSYNNDGPFAFMQDFLEMGGLTKEGKSIYFGVLTKDSGTETPPEDAARLRQLAAENLTNIDDAERARRDQAGDVMTIVAILYTIWASLIADNGDFSGHIIRLVSMMPIFLAYGYKKSAKSGL
jgi:hypothetical protein